MTINNSIDSWLKAALQNKITNKNTWNAPLIDHFTNIEEYTEKKGINFQKATASLEGCVKVYSTRVDDVTDDTLKLLDSLNVEDTEIKQKKQKIRNTTLETNLSNITFKETKNFHVIEPFFYFFKEEISLLRHCGITSKGLLVLFDDMAEENYVNLFSYPLEKNYYEEKSICPTLNEIDPSITDKIFAEEENEIIEENIENNAFLPDFDYGVPQEREISVIKIEENTFGYTKGWAGPTFWKIKPQKKEKVKNEKKQKKEKNKINFLEEVDFSVLNKKGKNSFSSSEIIERRNNKWMMPEDHKYGINDLYKYLVKEGSFKNDYSKEMSFNDEIVNYNPQPIPVISYDNDVPEETEVDFKNVKNVSLSKKLHFRFRRTQKRVDLNNLQAKIQMVVEKEKETTLKDVLLLLKNYYDEKEFKDISLQYCMLSLLFLAQEKCIKLESGSNGELYIKI